MDTRRRARARGFRGETGRRPGYSSGGPPRAPPPPAPLLATPVVDGVPEGHAPAGRKPAVAPVRHAFQVGAPRTRQVGPDGAILVGGEGPDTDAVEGRRPAATHLRHGCARTLGPPGALSRRPSREDGSSRRSAVVQRWLRPSSHASNSCAWTVVY